MFKSVKTNVEKFHFEVRTNALVNEDENKNIQHYHSLFEVYYLTEGSCTYFIDNKTYKIEKGDLVLIPEGTIHRTQYNSDIPHSRMLINCSGFYIPTSILNDISKLIYVYHNNDIQKKIRNIFEDIKNDYRHPDKYSANSLQSLVHSLFILIARYPNQKSNASVKNEYIEKATNHIQKNFGTRISLDNVAKLCAITPEHMSRMFKKETGFGFSEYLTLVRLQHSEYLLKNQKLSVTEIAHLCGFEDSNYFSFIFKKKYGISPRDMKTKSHLQGG